LFARFLEEKRPDIGIDADKYSYDELYQLVYEFQQQHSYQTTPVETAKDVQVIDEDNVHT